VAVIIAQKLVPCVVAIMQGAGTRRVDVLLVKE